MLRQVHRAVPRTWTVIVLADRGLYARWLFRRITRLGGHPFLRINTGGTFRPKGHVRSVSLKTLVPEPGTSWQGTGIAFQGRHRQLHCTLLARWEAGYQDPWLLLTDLPPEASTACWYGLRAWIEQGFKITKRAGWQWQRTHMTKPERAARLWLGGAGAPPPPPRVRGGGGGAGTPPPGAGGPCPPPLAAQRRGRGGRARPRQHGPGRHGPGAHATADAACHPSAARERLSPGLEPHPGGVARSGAVTHGALYPRALAGRHGAGGTRSAPAGPRRAAGRLRPQAAGATEPCGRVQTWVS